MTSKQIVRTARRLYRFCVVNGRLDSNRARDTAGRLAASRRRGSLAVLQEFERLVRLDQARHRAVVASATPLADDLRDDVRQRLERAYGGDLVTTFVEDPALIAGLRVRVGSDVYDGSVRAKLAALEARV
jgi:F-type H+-transporting ATPase subunit delta